MSIDPLENRAADRAAYGSDVDTGLQAHMRRVYNLMCMGLGVTGVTAYAVAAIPSLTHLILGTPLAWVVMFAPLAFLWIGFSPQRLNSMSTEAATSMFIAFSAVMGLSMSTIFIAFTHESIARVFFITAATFAATSLYGYTTKRNLASMGSFMFMGLTGIFFAALFNVFFHSAMIQFVVSVIGIAVFTGLAAWETQMIKESYRYGDEAANNAMAVRGALSMYLNFINLFQSLIQLMGDRR